MIEGLVEAMQNNGPWAIFCALLFIAYYRLVNDVIAVVRKNTEASTIHSEAIKQATQVMIEVTLRQAQGPNHS